MKKFTIIFFTHALLFFSVFTTALANNSSEGIDSYWFALLNKVVAINSGTTNIEGLNDVRHIFIEEFEKIGFETTVVELKNNRKIVYFQMPNSRPNIVFLGHIDTVFSLDSSFKDIEVKDNTIIGPGVIDMKGGIILMLNILSDLKENREILKNVRIILTDEEEVGSMNSKEQLQRLTKSMKHCLVFEPGLANGDFVTGHSGVKWIKISVKGKSAHAGLEHDIGVNSIVDLSNKIVKISQFTDYSNNLTVNPGVITGGKKANVVPDEASVIVDIRYRNNNDLELLLKKIEEIVKTQYVFNNKIEQGTIAELIDIAQLPAMPESKAFYLMGIITQIGKNYNLNFTGVPVGYGSDANHIASYQDVQIIDGLGPYGGGMHTEQEFMLISSYTQRLIICKDLVIQLSQ
jgi:glutamate carboxypeptidase